MQATARSGGIKGRPGTIRQWIGTHPLDVQTDTTKRPPPDSTTKRAEGSTRADTTRQKQWQDDAWNQIVAVRGVQIAYLYYAEADNINDGVVIRLSNDGDCPVRVSFTVVFRSSTREVAVDETYSLGPGERKTGTNDGLFWIPFQGGETIAEVGLRGLRVQIDASRAPADACPSP